MLVALLQRLDTDVGNLVSIIASCLSAFGKVLVALAYSIILSNLLAVMGFADAYFVSMGLSIIFIHLLELLHR